MREEWPSYGFVANLCDSCIVSAPRVPKSLNQRKTMSRVLAVYQIHQSGRGAWKERL